MPDIPQPQTAPGTGGPMTRFCVDRRIKLTADALAGIRASIAAGEDDGHTALQFGVTRSTVGRIRRGEMYRPNTTFAERFAALVSPEPNTGCWLWAGPCNGQGYGRVRFGRKEDLAHRVSWRAEHGAIRGGLWVLHRCDNPTCVNPAHLFLGMNADNVADKVRKDRQIRGERCSYAKITAHDVVRIRELGAGGESQEQIALAYGVSRAHISKIIRRLAWR